ncbi:MAG: xylulokinase [Sciscionella sp.]
MPTSTLVAGVDSSTQSTKVVVCDADTGAEIRSASAPHPPGTECAPADWLAALRKACSGLLHEVAAISVAGQQHGLVTVDAEGNPLRPALLWNDTRSAGAAAELIAELGGPRAWADRVGSVPLASFTVTKLRWLAEHEPANAARVQRAMLPHDWLTWELCTAGTAPVTDRGDASGTGYFVPWTGSYDTELVRHAFGRELELPRVAGPYEAAGASAAGMLVGPGTGDNMGAALGLGLAQGDVVVSLGTSGTVFTPTRTPSKDPSGQVAGFADGTGAYLPLVCTLNAALVLRSTAELLGVDLRRFDELALAAEPGAGGVTVLPYFDGERTPNRPQATGVLRGITTANATAPNLARAAVEGMLCGLADGLDALRAQGVVVERVVLIGGSAASAAVRAVAPGVFGLPVVLPAAAQYVAIGAARQAAWTLRQSEVPPQWQQRPGIELAESDATFVRERYAELREHTTDW